MAEFNDRRPGKGKRSIDGGENDGYCSSCETKLTKKNTKGHQGGSYQVPYDPRGAWVSEKCDSCIEDQIDRYHDR